MSAIAVDFVSDVVCPWCFIGMKRLEQALESSGVDAEIRLHPFQLDPSAPALGADLREHLRAKFGFEPERMFGRVEQEARQSGIPLDFSKVGRTTNTLKAHVLIGAAGGKAPGTQLAVAHALFEAYFLREQDIGDDVTLVEIASAHGFEPDEARALLADARALANTRAEIAALSAQGIGGVPFTIFEGKLAVSGAQPVEVFRQAIDRARNT